jgi:hypothetical protein
VRAQGVRWFGPRVRFPDDIARRPYTIPMTEAMNSRMLVLAALTVAARRP